jgi:thiol-disulfide isomerase/thioredoxin
MRRLLVAIAAVSALAGPAFAQDPMPLHETPRALLSPGFSDAGGRKLTLDDFRGKVVLLNVWATWCVPCREEMPTLDALQAQLGGEEFIVAPLSIDEGGLPPVKKFYDEIGIAHLGIYLAESIRAQFALGVFGLPTTMLIDRDGREIARLVGPAEWDSPEMIAFLQPIMAKELKCPTNLRTRLFRCWRGRASGCRSGGAPGCCWA